MGRRRRRWREPGYVWWIGFAVLIVAALLLASWRLALITLAAWCLYEFSLIPSVCRVTTREGFACGEPVRGRLYACSPAHQQIKNEALWGLVGMRSPFRRASAPDPERDTGVVVYSPPVRARLAQNDRYMLTLAAVGTVVAVVVAVASM